MRISFLWGLMFLWLYTNHVRAEAPSEVDLELFEQLRTQLVGQMEPGSMAVVKGAVLAARNDDVDHPFRQLSDFYYLTGFEEPDTYFVLLPGEEKPFVMFVMPRSYWQEIWTGKRWGVEGAREVFRADEAYPSAEF